MHGANPLEKSVVANLDGAAKPLPKRQRTAQACVQCNKSKAKCEIEAKVPVCRRCFRLGLPCEFAGGSRPPRALAPSAAGGGPPPPGSLQGYHHSMAMQSALHPSPYALAHAVHAGLNPMAPQAPYFQGGMYPGALPPSHASHFQSPPHMPPHHPHHYHPALFAGGGGGIPSAHGGPSAMPNRPASSSGSGGGGGERDPGMQGPPFVQSSSSAAGGGGGGALSPSSGISEADHHAAAARHALAAQLSSQHGTFLAGHHHAMGMHGPPYMGSSSGEPSSAQMGGPATSLGMTSSGAPVANLSSSSSPSSALASPPFPPGYGPTHHNHHLGGSHWEHGILAALTQNGRAANEVPLELLREWTLVAMHRKDCALLGRTMTLAASCGHSMESLLDSVGPLSSLLGTVNGLFMQAVLRAAAPIHPSSAHAATAAAGAAEGELGASADAVEGGSSGSGSEGTVLKNASVSVAADEAMFVLPQCTSWIEDGPATASRATSTNGSEARRPAQLVLMKQVANGKVSFFTSKAFEAFVVPKDRIEASWYAKGRPAAELFLHPEDAPVVCAYIGRLWKSLVPSPRPTPAPPAPDPCAIASTSTAPTEDLSSSSGDAAAAADAGSVAAAAEGVSSAPESSLLPPPPSESSGASATAAAAAVASKAIAAGAAGSVVSEQTAAVDLPSALRVWVTAPYEDAPESGSGGGGSGGAKEEGSSGALMMGSTEECYAGYVPCALRAQVVVSKTTDGQTSLVVLAFRPILTEPVPPPPALPPSSASSSTAETSSSSFSSSSEDADSATAVVATAKPAAEEEEPAAAESNTLPLTTGASSESISTTATTTPSRAFTVGCMGIDGLAGAPPAGSSGGGDAAALMLAPSRNTQFWKRVSVAAAGDVFQFAAS